VRRRLGALGFAAVAAAVLALLAGCVTIPTGGGVSTEKISQDQGGDNTIRAVSKPQPGATPSEIVAGFVRAGGGPQGGYEVAREYLADSIRSKWSAGASTYVSDSSVTPVADGEDTDASAAYTVSLAVVGQIDASGAYTAQSSSARSLSFHLVKERGQWRIDRAPDGTVLRTRDLGIVAKPYDLYFFDPAYDYLVPDVRWFADQGGVIYLARRIVSTLLGGPAPWLAAPVTVSAFPAGTQPGPSAPSLDAGTMTIDLSAGVSDAGAQQQQRMLQQLTGSLRALNVNAVRMTANGLAVSASDPSSADGTQAVPYEAIGSDGKTFGSVTSNGVAALPQLGPAIQELAPTAVSLGRDRSDAAVLGTGGVSLVSTGGHPVVDARTGLLPPSLDPGGWVWSAQGDPGSLIAVRADGKSHPLPIPISGRLVSIELSRDGTRLLAGLATDSGARLIVLGVQRDKDGTPVGFNAPLDLPVDTTRALIDATWLAPDTVVTLAGDPAKQDLVSEFQLGGLRVDHASVTGGTAIAAGTGSSFVEAVRVLLATGDLMQPSLVGDWQPVGAKLSLLGTQQ
jgi:hypothetical protein